MSLIEKNLKEIINKQKHKEINKKISHSYTTLDSHVQKDHHNSHKLSP